jgi:hypothetical protein
MNASQSKHNEITIGNKEPPMNDTTSPEKVNHIIAKALRIPFRQLLKSFQVLIVTKFDTFYVATFADSTIKVERMLRFHNCKPS